MIQLILWAAGYLILAVAIAYGYTLVIIEVCDALGLVYSWQREERRHANRPT